MSEIPKLSLEGSGLKKTDASRVSRYLKQVIERMIQQGLNLTKLEEIVICKDFRNEVLSFQNSVGLAQEITSEPDYVAVGKTIWYRRSESGIRAKIFIDATLVRPLGTSESATIGLHAIKLLVHELGHVHDDTYITDQFGSIDPHCLGDPEEVSLLTSRGIWGEYHAEFISLRIYPEASFEEHRTSLRSIQDGTVSIVTSAHDRYQIDNDISHLWSTIVTQSSIHLQAVARIAPYVESLRAGAQRESMRKFFGVFACTSWSLVDELKTLRPYYGQWDAWSWSRLKECVGKMWRLCGVSPEAVNSGCFVHVLVPPEELFR